MGADKTARRRTAWAMVAIVLAAGINLIGPASPAGAATPGDRYHQVTSFVPLVAKPGEVASSSSIAPGAGLQVDVRRGYFGEPITSVPSDASAAWVRIGAAYTPLVGQEGGAALLAHPCERAADPSNDGVLGFPGTPTAEALLPLNGGRFCLSSTVGLSFVNVTVLGYVDTDAAGAAWVDLPDRPVAQRSLGGSTTEPLDLASAGVPADATAVALWWYGTTSSNVTLSVAPCSGVGTAVTGAGSAPSFVGFWLWATADTPCLTSSGSSGTLTVGVAGYFRVGSAGSPTSPPQMRVEPLHAPGFVAVAPTRLFDTRTTGEPMLPGKPLELSLADLPESTTAVALNVTATEPTGPGFVTVWPCSEPQPLASNLNFTAGQTIANAVMVGLGRDRRVCFASLVPTHLLADLAGRFQVRGGHGYRAATPARLFDTRAGAPLPGGAELPVDLTGRIDDGTSAVVLNVTATQPSSDGYVTAYPCGTTPPLASSLNLAKGATVPNLVTVKVPADKRVCFTSNVTLHLLADLVGSYTSSSTVGFVDVTPSRVFDTRDGPPVPAGRNLVVSLTVRRPAWVLNATVADATQPGYLTGHDCTEARPTTSNLNYVAGQTVPNLMIVQPAPTLIMCIYAHGTTHVVADLAGYFTDEVFPVRYVVGAERPI